MVRRYSPRCRILAVAVLLGVAACALAGAPVVHHKVNKHTARETVEGLEEQWRQAQLNGDVGAMDRLLSDDFVGISVFGQVTTKAQQLAHVRDHSLALTQFDLSDIKVKLIGTTAAVVTSLADLAGTSDGTPISGKFRYTRVYQRLSSGAWKITSFEATRVAGRRNHPEPEASENPVPDRPDRP